MYYILVNNSLEIPELWLENLINTFKSDLIYSSNNEIILKRSIDIYISIYIHIEIFYECKVTTRVSFKILENCYPNLSRRTNNKPRDQKSMIHWWISKDQDSWRGKKRRKKRKRRRGKEGKSDTGEFAGKDVRGAGKWHKCFRIASICRPGDFFSSRGKARFWSCSGRRTASRGERRRRFTILV